MAQGTLNRPGSQEDKDNEAFDPGYGYDPQKTPLGDPTDPTANLPPGAAMGGANDPMGRTQGTRPGAYDRPGSSYDDDEESKLDKVRKGVGAARGLTKGVSKANKVRKKLKKSEGKAGSRGDGDNKGSASPSDLKDAESRPGLFNRGDDDDGGFFNPNDKGSRRSRAKRFLGRHKKKAAIGGGAMGIAVGGGLGLFLVLLPLKLEHIVDNLEGSFFSTSQSALQTETRNLVKGYLISRVMPGYKRCGGTIKPGCTAWEYGSGPVSNLYRSWSNARIERQLAEKGFRLEYKKLPGKWYLETPDITGGVVDIGPDGSGLGKEIDNVPELRSDVDKFIKSETKWYQVYKRYKWGRYFERQDGLPRCVIVCRVVGKDRYYALHGSVHEKKITAKLILVRNVITPHNQTMGIVIECLIKSCAAADNQPSGEDGINGTSRSATDKEITDSLRKYGGTLLKGVPDEELVAHYREIEKDGLQKYLVKKALTPIIGETAAGVTGDLIPLAGWMNLAAQLVNTANNASKDLLKLRYEVNGRPMALLAATWLIYRDEIHSGNADATQVGSFANSLSPGDQGAPDGKPTGGTAGAEQTRLYQAVIEKKQGGGSAAAVSTLTGNPLVGKAYAASAQDIASGAAGEICNNGLPPPAGLLICNEDFLGGGNSIANTIHDFLNSDTPIVIPGTPIVVDPAAVSKVATVWKDTIGIVFNFAGGALAVALSAPVQAADAACGLPGWAQGPFGGYCAARDLAKSIIPSIVEGVTRWLIPDPFGVPLGGGRNFVLGAGGFDYLGNDSPHRLLGAQRITPAEKAKITGDYQQEQKLQFSRESFFARMFDGGSQYSLISKLAMDVPLGGPHVAIHDGLSSLLNPLSILGHGFGSIFSGQAGADSTPMDDPFGITQYGYPPGTIPGDPETYWKNHCSDNEANAYQKDNSWNEAASGEDNADPNTGEPLNKTTNPCLLIKATVGADGGLFDTSNLTKDDLADLQGSSGSVPTAGTTGYKNPFRDISSLGLNRVDEGVDYYGAGPVYAIGNGVVNEVANADGSSLWWGGYGGYSVVYKLSDGPAAGKSIYVAEHCPVRAGIHAGSHPTHVTSSTVLCDMQRESIETGWALGDGTDQPSAGSVYSEGNATAYGQNFEELMEKLGVGKACYDNPGQPLQGSLPRGWPTWTSSPATHAGSNSC